MSRENIIYVNSLGKDLSFYLTTISSPISTLPIIEEQINVETPIGASIFFQRLQRISPFSQLKALIFIYCHPPDLCYPFYHFRERCRQICAENGAICYFSFVKTFMAFVGLTMSQVKVKIFNGETIILVSPRGDPVTVWSMVYRNGKYFILDYRILPWQSNPYNWKKEVIGFRIPNKVIFMRMGSESNLRNLVRAFKDMNPIIPNFTYVGFIAKAVVELVQQLSGEISHGYKVVPLVQDLFLATKTKALGKISNADKIPSTLAIPIPEGETIFCGIRTVDVHMQELDDNRHFVNLSQFRKTPVEISLKVDVDGFFEYEIQPKYETSETTKGKLILFDDFLSVKVFKNGVEEVLEDLQKVPYFVNFSEKAATFGKLGFEKAKKNPTFVVYDLIKILSLISLEDIDPNWTFSLTSNAEHSVLVNVETIAGKRQYTPPFIFALFCKWIILQIKKFTGDFLDELEVDMNNISSEIKHILKENIIASFRMLKIKLKFV
uniref:Uncharacterized protein n=1 Tax=Panagrolaimus sp. PS1159 TaxID=55785 RepID=A0AC35GMP1_9BILA